MSWGDGLLILWFVLAITMAGLWVIAHATANRWRQMYHTIKRQHSDAGEQADRALESLRRSLDRQYELLDLWSTSNAEIRELVAALHVASLERRPGSTTRDYIVRDGIMCRWLREARQDPPERYYPSLCVALDELHGDTPTPWQGVALVAWLTNLTTRDVLLAWVAAPLDESGVDEA